MTLSPPNLLVTFPCNWVQLSLEKINKFKEKWFILPLIHFLEFDKTKAKLY